MKLSDALVLDARIVGEAQERSIAGQVEFWAKLGRTVEVVLDGRQVLALCRSTAHVPLAKSISEVNSSAGHKRLRNYLESVPYPHYEPHSTRPGFLVRREEDGTETVGRFVNREFVSEARRSVSLCGPLILYRGQHAHGSPPGLGRDGCS